MSEASMNEPVTECRELSKSFREGEEDRKSTRLNSSHT